MTSFYGGGAFGSGSNSEDKFPPVKNLINTDTPAILSELSDGLYSLTGTYKYFPDDIERPAVVSKLIEVQRDLTNQEKKVKFDLYEDGLYFIATITCHDDGATELDKVLINNDRLDPIAPGIVSSDNPLPTEGYKAGEMWRVTEDGEYAGHICEVGDLILCIKSYETTFSALDFTVVQANLSEAVTSPGATEIDNIPVFTGSNEIGDSGLTKDEVTSTIEMKHQHSNKEILDSYDKSQEEIISFIVEEARKDMELEEF